jgi:hypothetical protein
MLGWYAKYASTSGLHSRVKSRRALVSLLHGTGQGACHILYCGRQACMGTPCPMSLLRACMADMAALACCCAMDSNELNQCALQQAQWEEDNSWMDQYRYPGGGRSGSQHSGYTSPRSEAGELQLLCQALTYIQPLDRPRCLQTKCRIHSPCCLFHSPAAAGPVVRVLCCY